MARSDGFPVMDVSTDILNDPKFRRVQRDQPAHVANAVTGYIATVAESWKAGRRISVVDAWPVLVPYDETAVSAMTTVGLLDKGGQVPAKTWNGWFGPAKERRDAARDRWRRANDRRADPTETRGASSTKDNAKAARSNGGTSRVPRGDRDVSARPSRGTATTVPLRPYRTAPSVPLEGSTAASSSGDAREADADQQGTHHQDIDELPGFAGDPS